MSQQSITNAYEMPRPDREIQFNSSSDYLRLAPQEKVLYTTRNAVDLRQSQNIIAQEVQGTLTVTTLRIVYNLDLDITNNLSIGYQSVQKILVGNLNTIEAGHQQRRTLNQQDKTLVFLCSSGGAKFRFEFLPRGSKQVFDIVQTVYRAYDTSRGFRRMRMTTCGQLPGEYVEETLNDVASISGFAPKALPGTLKLSNLRILWAGSSGVQISIPYIDIIEVAFIDAAEIFKDQNINNQKALIITTSPPEDTEKGSKIGFIPFSANIETLHMKLTMKIEAAYKAPNYGVSISYSDNIDGMFIQDTQQVHTGAIFTQKFGKEIRQQDAAQDLINQQARQARTVLAYLQAQNVQKDIVFDQELGLAFEKSDFVRSQNL